MTITAATLLELLPAVYRTRDAAGTGPLAALLDLIAAQLDRIEAAADQAYDDLFIETCATWLVPYIGDAIGYRLLHGEAPAVASPRAEVAHTIGYRRRKGTAATLEQLARDVSGWPARAIEFFERLAASQYMNHLRPALQCTPDLRRGDRLEWLRTAFDDIPRTVEVRCIGSGRGRYNIPNVGIALWRIGAHQLTRSPAVAAGPRRFHFSPLGHDLPLVNRPQLEPEVTHLADPFNVPTPITRRALAGTLAAVPQSETEWEHTYYGITPPPDEVPLSFRIWVDDAPWPRDDVLACDLADAGATWARGPHASSIRVDPERGRLVLPTSLPATAKVQVTFHYGFSAELGGGEYPREESLAPADSATLRRVPGEFATIAAAVADLRGAGVVEVTDSGRYEHEDPLALHVPADRHLEIRAADGCRPTIVLRQPIRIDGGKGARAVLNGLLITGDAATVEAQQLAAAVAIDASGARHLDAVDLVHCTLVPGLALKSDGTPGAPGAPSLTVTGDVVVTIDRCIVGGVRADGGATVRAADSVIDATDRGAIAYAGPDDQEPGGAISAQGCTIIGLMRARELTLVSDSILLGTLPAGWDGRWAEPVGAERTQSGCVRFSWAPKGSRLPRRFRCQPADSRPYVSPCFVSLRYGTAAYAQLSDRASRAVRCGAHDEGEMGAFHFLHGAQREANVLLRMAEYLRVRLEAGVLHES